VREQPREAEQHAGRRGAVALAVALVALVSLLDALVGSDVALISLLVAGPLVAAWSAKPLGTGAVALLAIAAAVPLGLADDAFLSTEHTVEIAGVALVGLLATLGADVQARLEAARARSEFLAGAGRLLETPPDPDAMLADVAGLAIPELADLCVVDLLGDDGRILGAATAAADPAAAEALRALRERFPLDPQGDHPVAVALRTGNPQLLPELDAGQLERYAAGPEHLELMLALQYTSALVVPLRARGRTLGVVSLLQLSGRRTYGPDDLELARELARRAALALDNARLVSGLQRSEQRLEAILDNLGEAVTVQDPDFNLVYVNHAGARLLGYPTPAAALAANPGRLSGRFRLLDEQGRPVDPGAYPGPRAARGERPEPLLVRSLPRAGRDGGERWLLMKATTVPGRSQAAGLIVNVIEDVSATQRAAHHQRVLSEAGRLIGSSLDVDLTLERLAGAVVPSVGDWCRVDLADGRGELHHVALAAASEQQRSRLEQMRERYPPDPAREPGNYEALRTGRPVLHAVIDPDGEQRYARDEEHLALIRAIGTRSAAIVPIAAAGRALGTITVGTAESGRVLSEAELELVAELGRRAGVAVENARVHTARSHIATTLQRSLLPPRLPEIPGLAIAARFRAAGEASEVGGDFYDVFALGPDEWMLVIGDVTGKGPEAAAITSLARYTMRTAAAYEDEPADVLRRLDEELREDPLRRQICTALCLRLARDEDGFAIRLASGGHPLPYRIAAGRAAEQIGRPGTLLGAFPGASWPQAQSALSGGEALVLYTDGVTDTRGPSERFGQRRLAALLGTLGGLAADAVASRVDSALLEFEDGDQRDDVALIVLEARA
jgi:serine phosphatase RsbU (regulator of sigma subunit)/PAS domain-containing protein